MGYVDRTCHGIGILCRMISHTFFVQGIPVPKGSKSLIRTKSGRYVMVEGGNLKKRHTLKSWMRAVQHVAESVVDCPIPGPVVLEVTFWLPRGKTIDRDLPCVKPDWDKLSRGVCDALENAGVYENDSRITDAHVYKRYAKELGPGATITIREHHGEKETVSTKSKNIKRV